MLTGFASLGVLLYWLKGQESIVVLLVASDGFMEASADSDEDVWKHRISLKVFNYWPTHLISIGL